MDADQPITVRILLSEYERPMTFGNWAEVVERRLREAGVPLDDNGDVARGTMRRFDDPAEWGATIYVWTP